MPQARLLIVDDETLVVSELQETFCEEGYLVFTAGNATEALQLPEIAEIDLLLTDLKMPECDGIELYKQLVAQRGFRGAAILLSGHGAERNWAEAYQAGFDACLAKPVGIEQLIELAAKLCAPANGSE